MFEVCSFCSFVLKDVDETGLKSVYDGPYNNTSTMISLYSRNRFSNSMFIDYKELFSKLIKQFTENNNENSKLYDACNKIYSVYSKRIRSEFSPFTVFIYKYPFVGSESMLKHDMFHYKNT